MPIISWFIHSVNMSKLYFNDITADFKVKMVIITLSDHTDRARKDGKPAIRDIAEAIGMDQNAVYNIAKNAVSSLPFDTANKIITYMRQHYRADFNITHLLKYVEDK